MLNLSVTEHASVSMVFEAQSETGSLYALTGTTANYHAKTLYAKDVGK